MRDDWEEQQDGSWKRRYTEGMSGIVTADGREYPIRWRWVVLIAASDEPTALVYGAIEGAANRKAVRKLTDALDACDEVVRELRQKLGPRTFVITNESAQPAYVHWAGEHCRDMSGGHIQQT